MGSKKNKKTVLQLPDWNWWQTGGFIAIIIFAWKGEITDFIELLNTIKNLWSG